MLRCAHLVSQPTSAYLQHLQTAGVAVEGAAVDKESEEVINTFDWELASLTDCLLEQIQLC